MLLDPKSVGDWRPVSIHGNSINQVTSFKYLGVHIDCDFRHTQVEMVCTRVHQCLHFLRRLFGGCRNIMAIFYRATIESIIRYGITCWFGNPTVKCRSQINSLVKTASKIMGPPALSSPQDLFEQAAIKQAKNILTDTSHVLSPDYTLLKSGRRYRVPLCKHNRLKYSFIPLSIKLIN